MMDRKLLKRQFNVPFDKVIPDELESAIDALLKEAEIDFKIFIKTEPKEKTFENTMLPSEKLGENAYHLFGIINHLVDVDRNDDIVKAHEKIEPKIQKFFSELGRNPEFYSVIKEYSETFEAKNLQGPKKKLLEDTLRSFKKSGVELDETSRTKLSTIDVKLGKLCTKFSTNVAESMKSQEVYVLDESQLEGIPQVSVDQARAIAEQAGKEGWSFKLNGPNYIAIVKFAENREIREEMYCKFNSVASSGEYDNTEIIGDILKLRQEKAELLGYDNFADLVLADRMAKTGKTAMDFLNDLKSKVEPHVKKENQELESFVKDKLGIEEELRPWDVAFYSTKLKKAKYDFDEEKLRPYFKFDNVLDSLFDLFKDLYGVSIKPNDKLSKWKGESVNAYDLFDEDGIHLGSFYTDYFPRDEKRQGAWMGEVFVGEKSDNGVEAHLGYTCGNLRAPTKDTPSLLSHQEVETVFHEFGHLMHLMLSHPEIRSQAGPVVEWDFVEVPSQIMENWLGEEEFLDRIAEHYETGENLPSDLLKSLMDSKNFQAANNRFRQLSFGLVDLKLHLEYNLAKHGSVKEYTKEHDQEFSSAKLPDDYCRITSFMHLFGDPVGYACAYYSYQWAEVFEADAFSRFKNEGLYNRSTGMDFREKILAKGSSENASKMFEDFMGRPVDKTALLKRDGLE